MGNYIVTYDLNGSTPTHKQVDDHLKKLSARTSRILETVWHVRYSGTRDQVYDHINSILSANDRLIVITASTAKFRKLLVSNETFISNWTAT